MSLARMAEPSRARSAAGGPIGVPDLVVRTAPIEDPGPLLALLPDAPVAVWLREGEGMVGWGEAARWEGWGARRFADGRDWLASLSRRAAVRDDVARLGSGLIAFGAFGFGEEEPDDADGTLRPSVLVVPAIVIGHRDGAWWATTAARADDPAADPAGDPAAPSLRAMPLGAQSLGAQSLGAEPLGAEPPAPVRRIGAVRWRDGASSADRWGAAVQQAIEAIEHGRTDKVVLARDLIADADAPIDARAVLGGLAARYPSCWTFSVDGLIGATPEMLVRVAGGVAESRVLAGTLRRPGGHGDLPDAARAAAEGELAATLLASAKDRREHAFSVHSVVSALEPHCRSVAAPAEPFVLSLPNVLHLASDVSGEVVDSSAALALAEALHPTAAVCGSPREAARALIEELEPMDRGRYAGPVGWQSADGDGEWGIALRCAETDAADPRRMRLFAGAGIVAQSVPAAEIAETDAKFAPMREALSPPIR